MTNFTTSMFESIKETLESQKTGSGNFKDILKTPPGNSYIVRFIPNVKEPSRTMYHYFHHGWNSKATGQYVNGICPTTWGDPCSICMARMKLYQSGTEEDTILAKDLKRKENWLVNVVVVKDPKNPENDGQVKMVRYGKQVDKIVTEAISGEDADEFGAAIFDLTKNGCNFRIKVEKNEGDYPTYVSSKFLSKSAIEGFTAAKIEEVYENMFELDTVFETKTDDQLVEMLNEHFYGKDVLVTSNRSSDESEDTEVDLSDLTDDVEETSKDTPAVDDDDDDDDENIDDENIDDADEKINELLADL